MTNAPRAPWSLWCLGSVVCALLVIPPVCATAVLLGVVGLVDVKRHPGRRGRGAAIFGVSAGLVCSFGWIGLGWLWNSTMRAPMLEGPRAALVAGQAGDVEAFRAAFIDPADAAASRAFLDEVTARYGRLGRTRQAEDRVNEALVADRFRPVLPYDFTFEGGLYGAQAQFVVRDDDGFVARFAWLLLEDERLEPLVYPPSARTEALAAAGK